jgi:curved DNA-binding protein CbpA
MKNYYLILEIQANASFEAIKRAYRRLSKLYHPDINPRGGEQFKDINEANSILSDSEKRKVYDIKHKAAFSTGQNKNASNQPKQKANNTPNNTNVKTNTTSFTKTSTSNNGIQSTITVNGIKINVTGNNTTVNVVNGKVIIETKTI